jgi:hypothetical protein
LVKKWANVPRRLHATIVLCIWWIAHQWTHQISFFSGTKALKYTKKYFRIYFFIGRNWIYVYYLKKGMWVYLAKNHDYFISSIYLVVSPQNVSLIVVNCWNHYLLISILDDYHPFWWIFKNVLEMSFDFNCCTFVRLAAAPLTWAFHGKELELHLQLGKVMLMESKCKFPKLKVQLLNGAISRTIS